MKKEISKKQIVTFCLSDMAKGIFTCMLANYLIYFFQPSTESGITPLVTQGLVVFGFLTFIGLVKAVGHIFDAFSDPLVANWSDKCKSKNGRRIPFMKWSAIPFGLSTLLIFLPPMPGIHWLNNVWVAVFIWLHFLFYTAYVIPQGALFPELITDPNKRIFAYSIRSLFFVTGSALIYMVPLPVSLLQKAGLTANLSYQVTFIIFTIIGIAFLLVSAFSIKEKDFVDSKITSIKLFPALKATFKNKEFTKFTVGHLLEITSMAFFQACIMYYVTSLLHLPTSMASLILAISIATSIAMYPFIVAGCKKFGKKPLLICAIFVFILAYLAIYFLADWMIGGVNPNTFNLIKGVGFAIVVSFPFAALNIVPATILSDIIQYDTLMTGENKEGLFSASQSFITKLGQSLAIMAVPSIIAIGAMDGSSVGRSGLKITALISAGFCVLSLIFFFSYNEKKILGYIRARRAEQQIAVSIALADMNGEISANGGATPNDIDAPLDDMGADILEINNYLYNADDIDTADNSTTNNDVEKDNSQSNKD